MTIPKTRCLPPLAFLLACLGLGQALQGCTYMKEAIGLGPQKPTVQLAEIEVGKISLTGCELLVTLRVDNPNDFDLEFSKLRYTMVVSGRPLAAGTFGGNIIIKAKGRAAIKLPLNVDASAVLLLAQDLMTKPTETVAVMTATADFQTPLGKVEVSFEEQRPLTKLAGF